MSPNFVVHHFTIANILAATVCINVGVKFTVPYPFICTKVCNAASNPGTLALLPPTLKNNLEYLAHVVYISRNRKLYSKSALTF